ncbi:MAG: DUF1800 family protein, partial [Sphingobacteriaceae bacterium]|nr:DUF1800 family protein [Cytophagaceae bacterium]
MNEPNKQTKLQHLFWRAGFGASPQQVRAAMEKPLSETIAALFQDAKTENSLDAIPSGEPGYNRKAMRELIRRRNELSAEEKKAMVKDVAKENRGKIGDLNFQWLDQMGLGAAALREKMTLFWHGHFACRNRVAGFVQQQHNTIRGLALGKFGDLLRAVSQDPAMLQFLNNQQNKKDSPNENFAREVMELFTMGRGAYTEKDIREAARAFTGWGFIPASGDFVFRKAQHDEGTKTIFGKTGN